MLSLVDLAQVVKIFFVFYLFIKNIPNTGLFCFCYRKLLIRNFLLQKIVISRFFLFYI